MFSLFRKELSAFFASATGYIVTAIFLITTSLFLWIVPSNFNIFYGGYASLESFFFLAPWLFLFLAPAISMRLIAEERRAGTMELLLIRPLSALQIALAKYLAGLTLIAIAIIPTFIYVILIYNLSEPVGNIDLGATMGSYIGLLLLGAIYISIGIFCSSFTDNQIIAFIVATATCFVFYQGFDALANIPTLKPLANVVSALGIDAHYSSLSRGVVDSRDVVYFICVAAIFIFTTALIIERRKNYRNSIVAIGITILITIICNFIHIRIDLTQEHRYTLANVTRSFLQKQEREVIVNIYLDGNINPGFRRLKRATMDMLDELNRESSKGISAFEININDLKGDAAKSFKNELESIGWGGISVYETKEDGQKIRSVVYPYAEVSVGENYTWVNLLENVQGLSGEENLNKSIESLEYKLVDAIRRVTTTEKQRVAFLEGHGELDEIDVVEATDALSSHFAVDRGKIGNDASILDPYKVIIIAKPTQQFSEKDKYVIDQYLMHGGRLLFLVDAVTMTLDSLRNLPSTIGLYADFNIEDQLFVYGFRINHEVVEDVNCSMIPISVAQGGSSQLVPMPWRFGALLGPNPHHPVTRNINPVRADFASYIDTVGENLKITRTPLLTTSNFTKVHPTPVFASLQDIGRKPMKEEFSRHYLPIAMSAEGVFPSVFAHRKAPAGLKNTHTAQESVPTRIIVVADGDIIRNDVRLRHSDQPNIIPLGYDELSRQTFGNRDFIVNAVQYLADDEGWSALRNRTITLRLLNKHLLAEGTTIYKILSIAIPLVMLAIAALVIFIVRKRKYN
ncbi:MAG: gliding motility-associated ABC transporter substrate-binding protein GldG [Bacteroidales bacterium]|nr:gliding motility-associated ABC transporter substrate-binding protein GldG [Bacteroidales bacterium]